MRSLGFAREWDKLNLDKPVDQRPDFTTFRVPRKDADRGRDWSVGETVQVVYRSRTPQREVLGVATIISAVENELGGITDAEAVTDGFPGGWQEMANWLAKAHKGLDLGQPLNKLTLSWRQNE